MLPAVHGTGGERYSQESQKTAQLRPWPCLLTIDENRAENHGASALLQSDFRRNMR